MAGANVDHRIVIGGYVGNDPVDLIDPLGLAEEHTKGARESTYEKHTKAQGRPKGGAKPGNIKPNMKPPPGPKPPKPPKAPMVNKGPKVKGGGLGTAILLWLIDPPELGASDEFDPNGDWYCIKKNESNCNTKICKKTCTYTCYFYSELYGMQFWKTEENVVPCKDECPLYK